MTIAESEETIFALASGRGRAGIAVVRVSGKDAAHVLRQLSGKELPEARRMARRELRDPGGGRLLDEAIVVWFPGPKSFTGEDVAELHVHGGSAVLGALFEALSGGCRCRPAEPGEFSLRAFRHGRLDLTAAEGLNDLVRAETEAQRHQALGQLRGSLRGLYEGWREELTRTMARIETAIDFSDEEVPANLFEEGVKRINALRREIAGHLLDEQRGERVRGGFGIVILGAPNAGKSSLMNALAREDVAITAETPGTTRDVIEVRLDLGGFAVDLADTAGLRDTKEAVEQEGVRRAEARSAAADVRLLVVDSTGEAAVGESLRKHQSGDAFLVPSKIDLVDAARRPNWTNFDGPVFPVSAKTGEGIEALLQGLEKHVTARLAGGEVASLTRARHRRALEECVAALSRASAHKVAETELVAEDLRLAARLLGRITGTVDVENILDVVFGEFCIGK